MKRTTCLPLILAAVVLGCARHASAATALVSENFDYTNGHTVNANTLNGGTGFSGAWTTNNMPTNGTGSGAQPQEHRFKCC